jgi:hypothetical protein
MRRRGQVARGHLGLYTTLEIVIRRITIVYFCFFGAQRILSVNQRFEKGQPTSDDGIIYTEAATRGRNGPLSNALLKRVSALL